MINDKAEMLKCSISKRLNEIKVNGVALHTVSSLLKEKTNLGEPNRYYVILSIAIRLKANACIYLEKASELASVLPVNDEMLNCMTILTELDDVENAYGGISLHTQREKLLRKFKLWKTWCNVKKNIKKMKGIVSSVPLLKGAFDDYSRLLKLYFDVARGKIKVKEDTCYIITEREQKALGIFVEGSN